MIMVTEPILCYRTRVTTLTGSANIVSARGMCEISGE